MIQAITVALLVLWAYNVLPGFVIEPRIRDQHHCLTDGDDYRWNVIEHRWDCHDNWWFPGFHGV